jgi:hypothetical protein
MAKARVQSERELQNAICKYLKLRYPKVKFRTDKDGQFAIKKTLGDKAMQASAKGFPDMIVREKRKGFNALVIELKKEDVTVFRKDGTLRDDQHLRDQKEWLDWFEELGCKATFSCGWDETKNLIDSYLS